MKTVFTGQQVCHVWAQQNQPEGRNSTKTVFFDGPSIYSYGRHFEMARFVDDVVLLNCARYSVTTSKHQSWVRHAINHHTVFEVPSMFNHSANVAYLIDQAKERYDKASRARKTTDWLLERAEFYIQQVNGYLSTFCAPVPTDHLELWHALRDGTYLDGEVQAELLRKAKEAQAKEREADRQRELKRAAEERESLEKWMQGETQGYRYFTETRLRVKDNEVQTSRGASVPLIEAKKLYRALQAKLNVQGQRIGHFTVNRIEEGNIVIGCHTIPLSEIERIAPEVMAYTSSESVLECSPN